MMMAAAVWNLAGIAFGKVLFAQYSPSPRVLHRVCKLGIDPKRVAVALPWSTMKLALINGMEDFGHYVCISFSGCLPMLPYCKP